jgi:glycosyltransferase involved in cell wall biosynthesis
VKVTVLALTLNEIDGVKAILPKIDRAWYHQLIVVDGRSTDGTIEWCRDNGYEVFLQSRKGIRHAYLEVLPSVTGDVILTLSPDGNCDPAMIPRILDKMAEGLDMVIGSRYLGDASSDDDDIVTGFGNWLFTRTVNVLHSAHYTDCMVIYRAFRRTLIEDLDLDKEASYSLPERLFGTIISWEPLMSVRAAKARKRIAEIPAGEPARIGGHRKLQILRWGAAYYFQFWRELWFWRPKISPAR